MIFIGKCDRHGRAPPIANAGDALRPTFFGCFISSRTRTTVQPAAWAAIQSRGLSTHPRSMNCIAACVMAASSVSQRKPHR